MAFRAVLATTYNSARSVATQLQTLASTSKASMLAGNVSANVIGQLLDSMITGKAQLQAAAAVTGIAAYAKAQEGDTNYDVVAEWTSMVSACDGVLTWIVANVPTANGYVQAEQWATSGRTVRSFTTAQTAGLRTALDTFISSVA
jgi:hypothetical protein